MHVTPWKPAAALMSALAIVMVGLAAPADASPGDFVKCQQRPTAPECVLHPNTSAVPGAAGDGGGESSAVCRDPVGRVVPCYVEGRGWLGDDGCYYQLATGADLTAAEILGGVATPPAAWYVGSCGDPATNQWPMTTFRMFATPPGPALLAEEAVKLLRLPALAIRSNPAPPAPQVLFVPTWLWVDAGSWGARSATATAGNVSVTATATPVKVIWSTGDGSSVTCSGPGTPWTSGIDPAAASPTCGHIYTRAPPGGTYTLVATVTWQISWSGGGQSGTRPPLTTTAEVDLRVVEAGALNTDGVS